LTVALTAVAGFDPEDLATMAARGRIPAGGYTQYLAPQNGLRGARIGVLRQMFRNGPDHKEGRVIIERAIAELKNAGAIVCDPVNTGLPLFSLLREARVSDWEKKSATDLYLAGLGPNAKYRSLVDMIQQNSALLKNLAPMARVGRLDFDPAYLARLKTREELQKAISSLMDQYKLDAIVYPFKTIQATQIGAKRRDDADNALSSQTGFPALVLPAGFFSNGLPIAIEFLGRPFSEPVLLRLGSAYEECSHHHSPPAATPPLPGELIGG
jgi:Asp-tRNA(Asn)/Glu-tRNA(Gln) amidotransferase A subunit family amidase